MAVCLEEFPGELTFFRLGADAHEQRLHGRGVAPLRPAGQVDAVPLEVRGLLDAPGIGLVRAVGGEVEGAEGDVTDVEVAYSPFWVNTAPANTEKITIIIDGETR